MGPGHALVSADTGQPRRAGAEFGWRSGWAKWPDYYLDSLPPAVEMGRGSPTGIEVYSHYMFPRRYHNALFVCDWSRGRILSVKLKPHGASYKASSEVFLEGQPLNVTDISVGPDGWLYFCTGGRDTEGGVYRVVWEGEVPAELKKTHKGLAAALKQPQLLSAWARQQVAITKKQMGNSWQRTDRLDRESAIARRRARAGTRIDATVRSASLAGVAGQGLARSRSQRPGQGRVPDGHP